MGGIYEVIGIDGNGNLKVLNPDTKVDFARVFVESWRFYLRCGNGQPFDDEMASLFLRGDFGLQSPKIVES